MFGLGSSDSLRGIFAPAFESYWNLGSEQLSMIISASYAGNLVFLALGGKAFDKFSYKLVMITVCAIWLFAVILNAASPGFALTTLTIAVAMGSSTLLNTGISIVSGKMYENKAAMFVSLLFFVQGIGTSGTQMIAGGFASDFSAFKLVNAGLAIIGAIVAGILIFVRFPDHGVPADGEGSTAKADAQSTPPRIMIMAVIMFGMYFIAEHSIMNYMLMYETKSFAMDDNTAAMYLSAFWILMTIGRVVFSPLANKLGPVRTIRLFGAISCVIFGIGIFGGKSTLFLVSLSALAMSTLYPMMLLSLRSLFPEAILATATGNVIALATICDIAFNNLFGKLVEVAGYRSCFLMLPVFLLLSYFCFSILFSKRTVKVI